MTMANREDLLTKIANEEARLADLEIEVAAANTRLAALREQLVSAPLVPTVRQSKVVIANIPTTNVAKVALFRSLFRGREDVFPRRWENKKQTSGYSPACHNEWVYGVCEKKKSTGSRRTTCGECPNQAFITISDEELAKHLRGDQVLGVYPLLLDETCWFLAADFDKKTWQEDIAAFAETCDLHSVPVAIERSRSGNGAHAWFFFASPVPAVAARKLGCFLITETMARRHQLSMESYDRLFPNQDTMPKGGFGNLIALPLQREAREAGNSVFVDESFNPWPDQWAFLAGVKRIDAALVFAFADDASRRGQVIGVRMSDVEDDRTPWKRPPSGRPRKAVITEPLSPVVKAVLAQRIFIEKAGLPSALLNQLMRLAAFQNPEFYKKQSMRLSTALTPRVIACAEDLCEHIALPRGCLPEAEAMLKEYGVTLEVTDKREAGSPIDFAFHGTLTPLQEQAVKALLAHDTGVFVAPPGIGKTVVGTYLVAARKTSTLILVHRKPLLDQWISQLSFFLGIEPKDLGQIGAGRAKPNGRLDIAMVQSLVRKGSVADLIAGYGQVIQDESHHCPAVSFERVLAEVKARYVVGLTATPQRRDGHHPILTMQLGPVRFAVDVKSQAARRPFDHKLVVRETGFSSNGLSEGAGIQELYASLAADQHRNDLIFDDVVRALEEKRSPILLTERRDHLEYFAERLRSFTRHLVVLHGGMKPKERRKVCEQLTSIPDREERLLLATGRYLGEGFDDARLDTLFLALPVSWKGTLIQYTGRLHRLHPGKTEVRIYDYVDHAVPMLMKMFEKRLRSYRAIGYARDDAPFGFRMIENMLEYEKNGSPEPPNGQ
ncbi:MAG: restriction endonuclease subunit R [Deltaproteobacteria bacterium RIFOXYA12_FULL_61_11]|nr:MAG: restriction endonuclease subunit R [Deltaproteobacteria bacterium RIFOXYA12_FULL_61_11]